MNTDRNKSSEDKYELQGQETSLIGDGRERDSGVNLKLHEEMLDISKKRIQIAEVLTHKEIITEEKTFTIPVTREELVIEKKVFDQDALDDLDDLDQTTELIEILRIPVSEERIEFTKHPTILEEVEIYKRSYQETKHIEETLKKEQISIETIGNPKIL